MNRGLLSEGFGRNLGHVVVVGADEFVFEEGLPVPFVHALAHQAAHLLARVASEHDLLIIVDLAVHPLGVSVVVCLAWKPVFVGRVNVVALLGFAGYLGTLVRLVTEEARDC